MRDQDSWTEGLETMRNLSEAESSRTPTDSARTSSGTTERKRCDFVVSDYTGREEAEALYLLIHFGNEEALMHALKLPKYIRSGHILS